MNLDRITAWKNRIALAGAVLCFLAIVCAGDGSVAYLREPFNSFRLLPGESVRLTGLMAPEAPSLTAMTSESSSDALSITLEDLITGFWMGGRMWRGTLKLSPDIEPGKYLVSVFGKEDQKKVGSNTFEVIVYGDRESYLADSKSLVLRYSGFSPWIGAAFFFFLVLLTCGVLYVVAGKKERLMAEQGEAEIYHIAKEEAGFSIYFGLGLRNGVEKGSTLVLMDSKGKPLQEVMVESVSETDGVARLDSLDKVRTGYLVKKIRY